jgi:hypothetical protein
METMMNKRFQSLLSVFQGAMKLLGVFALTTFCAHAMPTQRTLGLTQAHLEALIYGDDDIPGFVALKPMVSLDVMYPEPGIGPVSSITKVWNSLDGRNGLRMRVAVFASPDAAQEYLRNFIRRSSSRPKPDPPDACLGDASWQRAYIGGSMSIFFLLGRVVASVQSYPLNRHPDAVRGIPDPAPLDAGIPVIVSTLAAGLEFMIRLHPELLAKTDTTQRQELTFKSSPASDTPTALTYKKVTWVPLAALKAAGLAVEWEPWKNRASVSHAGRRVTFRVGHRQASLGGVSQDLGAPVLLGHSGPVVPLRPIINALGLSVRTSGNTLVLSDGAS